MATGAGRTRNGEVGAQPQNGLGVTWVNGQPISNVAPSGGSGSGFVTDPNDPSKKIVDPLAGINANSQTQLELQRANAASEAALLGLKNTANSEQLATQGQQATQQQTLGGQISAQQQQAQLNADREALATKGAQAAAQQGVSGQQAASQQAAQLQAEREAQATQGSQNTALAQLKAEAERLLQTQEAGSAASLQKSGAEYATEATSQGARLQADAEARRIAQMQDIMKGLDVGSSGGGGGGVNDGTAQLARDSAFARAKDKSGLIARSALSSLRDEMASRGTLGSGIETGDMGGVIGSAAGGLDDLNTQQAISDADYATHVEDRNYQGNLTKRGQNMGMAQSLAGLVTARGLY